MLKFGYPGSLVREYDFWVVMVRPHQATLGALVLACKEEAQAFSDISEAAFAELGQAISDIEAALRRFRAYDKINYLMLMMVDREVHFHVLPRYSTEREFAGQRFEDPGWPAAPDLSAGPALGEEALSALVKELQAVWA
jgi:diadenosine tetraphosphate (Ap4A) HIT family hydrolase